MNDKTITIISHPQFLDHDTGGGDHPEVPDRLRAINSRMREGPLATLLNFMQPAPAEREWLLTFHTESWATQICQGRLLSILEGGYHLSVLGESVEAYLAGVHSRMQKIVQ